MVVLEAANIARDHRGRQAAKLQCSRPGGLLWHDSVQVSVGTGAVHLNCQNFAQTLICIRRAVWFRVPVAPISVQLAPVQTTQIIH